MNEFGAVLQGSLRDDADALVGPVAAEEVRVVRRAVLSDGHIFTRIRADDGEALLAVRHVDRQERIPRRGLRAIGVRLDFDDTRERVGIAGAGEQVASVAIGLSRVVHAEVFGLIHLVRRFHVISIRDASAPRINRLEIKRLGIRVVVELLVVACAANERLSE